MRGRSISDGVVTLAPITPETAQMFPKWVDDEEVCRYLAMYPGIPDKDQEGEWYKKTRDSQTDCVWEIVFAGRVVGISGIHHIEPQHGYAMTGTIIGDKTAWGQKVGTRSMILRAHFAFSELGLRVLETHVFVDNLGSFRAMNHCGFETLGIFPGRYYRHGKYQDVTYRVLRQENFYKLHPKG